MTTITAVIKVQAAALVHGTDDPDTFLDDSSTATYDDDEQNFCKEGG